MSSFESQESSDLSGFTSRKQDRRIKSYRRNRRHQSQRRKRSSSSGFHWGYVAVPAAVGVAGVITLAVVLSKRKSGADGSDGKKGSDGSDGSDGSHGSHGSDGSDGSDSRDGSDAITADKAETLLAPQQKQLLTTRLMQTHAYAEAYKSLLKEGYVSWAKTAAAKKDILEADFKKDVINKDNKDETFVDKTAAQMVEALQNKNNFEKNDSIITQKEILAIEKSASRNALYDDDVDFARGALLTSDVIREGHMSRMGNELEKGIASFIDLVAIAF